jgi:hypothetical protein
MASSISLFPLSIKLGGFNTIRTVAIAFSGIPVDLAANPANDADFSGAKLHSCEKVA